MVVFHRFREIGGRRLFYREAGPRGPGDRVAARVPDQFVHVPRPDPALADRYHVIAPDHLGFGLSDAPPVEEFDYTFDALADLTDGLLAQLGVDRYAIYVQDYGAPDRLAARPARPGGDHRDHHAERQRLRRRLRPGFWSRCWAYQREPTAETEAGVRGALTLEAIRWQYLTGVPDRDAGQPGHLAPRLRAGLAAGQRQGPAGAVPRLRDQPAAVPGAARVPAGKPGAAAGGLGPQRRDLRPGRRAARSPTTLPDAEIHLLDGGHFLLESRLDTVAGYLRGFLGRVLQPA